MFARSNALFASTIVSTILALTYAVEAQQPSPTTSKPTCGSSGEIVVDSSADRQSQSSPSPSPGLGLWQRQTLTGDWGGTRTRWTEHGVEMQFSLTGFVQGTAAGGLKRHTVLNGKFESRINLDFEKLWGWKYWSAEAKVEYRFGAPALAGTGAINAVNTDVTVPASQGSVAAITALNFTRVFSINPKKGDEIALSFGRYNTLEIQEKFFGGLGLEKFFNAAQIGPMTALRQVPNVTNGASIDY